MDDRRLVLFLQITVATAFSILLLGCASSGSFKPDGAPVVDVMKALKNGDIRMTCGVSCSGAWGSTRNKMRSLYNAELWDDLAYTVVNLGFESDQTYFYLGRATEELGYSDAAIIYYKLAMASFKCDSFPFNNCDGLVFPRDINSRKRIIAQKNTGNDGEVQIKTLEETKSTAIDKKAPLDDKAFSGPFFNNTSDRAITKHEWKSIVGSIQPTKSYLPTDYVALATSLLEKAEHAYEKGQPKKEMALQAVVLSWYAHETDTSINKELFESSYKLFHFSKKRYGFSEKTFVESLKNLEAVVEARPKTGLSNWISLLFTHNYNTHIPTSFRNNEELLNDIREIIVFEKDPFETDGEYFNRLEKHAQEFKENPRGYRITKSANNTKNNLDENVFYDPENGAIVLKLTPTDTGATPLTGKDYLIKNVYIRNLKDGGTGSFPPGERFFFVPVDLWGGEDIALQLGVAIAHQLPSEEIRIKMDREKARNFLTDGYVVYKVVERAVSEITPVFIYSEFILYRSSNHNLESRTLYKALPTQLLSVEFFDGQGKLLDSLKLSNHSSIL